MALGLAPHAAMTQHCRQALVVDDDAGLRDVIADALRIEGIDVVAARGAAEAIAALDAGCRPSVILLDLLMPEVTGEQLLPVLREHPRARGVPVLATSASPERLARIEGPDARLAKPFGLEDLLDTMDELCGRGDAASVALGVPILDSDHRRQLDLAEALAEALRGHQPRQRAASILNELIAFTREHFSSEGELMRRNSYPDSAAHLAEHARCVTELERWRESSARRSALPSVRDAIALKTSMAAHIASLDRDLARHLSGAGGAARADE